MPKGYFEKLLLTKPREFFTVFLLLFNSLTWFYVTRRFIYTTLNSLGMTHQERLIVWGVYDLSIIASSIAGSILSNRIRRSRIILSWILLGTITSALPALYRNFSNTSVLSISFLWGISFGLGMPSSLSHFGDHTNFENRGRIGGTVFFAVSVSAPLIVMLSGMPLQMITIISTVWRGFGLFMLLLLKIPEGTALEKRKHTSLAEVLHNRVFLLYLIPWFMFSFIAGFEKLIFENLLESGVYDSLRVIESIIGTISALIGGFVSDWIGRKKVVIYGFISLGLAYAFLGIAPTSYLSWIFSRVIDGIAWGVFLVLFVNVLWGDLSPSGVGSRERYYVIGSIPFFFADFIGSLFAPYVWIPANAAFSLASFFLFVAVLPLMYAPETLPERKIELRQLRKYVDKAKRIRERHSEESTKNQNRS